MGIEFRKEIVFEYQTAPDEEIKCTNPNFKIGTLCYTASGQMQRKNSGAFQQIGAMAITGELDIVGELKDPERLLFMPFDVVLPDRIVDRIVVTSWHKQGDSCDYSPT